MLSHSYPKGFLPDRNINWDILFLEKFFFNLEHLKKNVLEKNSYGSWPNSFFEFRENLALIKNRINLKYLKATSGIMKSLMSLRKIVPGKPKYFISCSSKQKKCLNKKPKHVPSTTDVIIEKSNIFFLNHFIFDDWPLFCWSEHEEMPSGFIRDLFSFDSMINLSFFLRFYFLQMGGFFIPCDLILVEIFWKIFYVLNKHLKFNG